MAGFFSRLKGKDGPTTLTKSKKGQQAASAVLPAKPKWSDAWTRTSVEAEEVQELLKGCTIELKSRGMPSVPYQHNTILDAECAEVQKDNGKLILNLSQLSMSHFSYSLSDLPQTRARRAPS
jgi:hypothetical protein